LEEKIKVVLKMQSDIHFQTMFFCYSNTHFETEVVQLFLLMYSLRPAIDNPIWKCI